VSTPNIDGGMGYHLINGLLTSEQNFQFVPTYLSVTSKLKRIVVNCICLQIEQSAWISENSKQKSVKLWASNRKVNSSFTSIELLQCLYERHCYCVQPRQQCLQGGTSAVSDTDCNQGYPNRWEPVRLPVKPDRPGSGSDRYETGQYSKFKFEIKKMKNS